MTGLQDGALAPVRVIVMVSRVPVGKDRIERRVARVVPEYQWKAVRVDPEGDRETVVLYGEGKGALGDLTRLADRIALVVWRTISAFTAIRVRVCCADGVLYEADYTASRSYWDEFYRDLMGSAVPVSPGRRRERPLRLLLDGEG